MFTFHSCHTSTQWQQLGVDKLILNVPTLKCLGKWFVSLSSPMQLNRHVRDLLGSLNFCWGKLSSWSSTIHFRAAIMSVCLCCKRPWHFFWVNSVVVWCFLFRLIFCSSSPQFGSILDCDCIVGATFILHLWSCVVIVVKIFHPFLQIG